MVPDGDIIHDFTLPMAVRSGNRGRGYHWSHAVRLKRVCALHLHAAGFRRLNPPDFRQVVTFVRVLGPRERLWDEANLALSSFKQLQDAMTDLGFWHDDSPRWLSTRFEQDATARAAGPAVRVIVRRA